MQLLSPSWVVDHGHLARPVDVKLAIVDEALDLHSDLLGVADVRLQVVVGPLELLDLGQPPCKFSLGVGLHPARLLDFLFGPSSLGGDLHQMARVALGHYGTDKHERLEKDVVGIHKLCLKNFYLPLTD